MRSLLGLIFSVFFVVNANAQFDPNNPTDPFEDKCGDSSLFALPFIFAANSADQVLCLNELNGEAQHDLEVAKQCFLGKRIKRLVSTNPAHASKQECRKRFLDHCSEIRNCDDSEKKDETFGGEKLFCGHLGSYLDFYWRIRGGLPTTFSHIEGVALCEQALQAPN